MSLIESSLLLAGNVDARTGFFFVSSSGSPKIHQLSCTGEIIVMSIYQGQPVETTYQDLDQAELSIQADANTEIAIVGNVTEISDIDALTSIDLRACRSLQSLSISSEELDRINLAGCRQLETLSLAGCTGLTVLDLSQNVLLESLDLSGCIGLQKLDVTVLSELQSLDVSDCTGLSYLDLTKTNKLSSLNIDGTQLTSPNNTLILASLLGGGGGVPEGVAMEATSQEILQKVSTITFVDSDITYGKEMLAERITNKGVPTSSSDSLVEMANKVNLITQSPIIVNTSDEYEEQLTAAGSLWNLYVVRAALSGNQELKNNYPCFILAEYFIGYDTISLQNATAYITSDNATIYQDEEGNWHVDVAQIEMGGTHVWHDDDTFANRWVCYLFGIMEQDYTIPTTDLCPRSMFIGGHLGTIMCPVPGRLSEIVCPDEVADGIQINSIKSLNLSTQNWGKNVTIKNVENATAEVLNNVNNIQCFSFHCRKIQHRLVYLQNANYTNPSVTIIPRTTEIEVPVENSNIVVSANDVINAPLLEKITVTTSTLAYFYIFGGNCKHIYLPRLKRTENLSSPYKGMFNSPNLRLVKIGYGLTEEEKYSTNTIYLNNGNWGAHSEDLDIDLCEGWRMPISLGDYNRSRISAKNIALHILDRLADNSDGTTLTIHIGSENIATINADETYSPYIAAAQEKNYSIV